MKNFIMLVLLAFTLIACQSQNEESTLIDSVSEISISKSNGYGGLNENYFASINQTEVISDFEEIFKNAKGINNKVDVTNEKPDFDILVSYENGETHGLHLVLGNEEESVIMYIGHEKKGYTISYDETIKLKRTIGVQ